MNINLDEEIKGKLSEIVLKSWQDPDFKLRLIEEPEEVCKEFGIEVEENDAKIIFHLDSKSVKHFIIPMNPSEYVDKGVQLDIANMAKKHVEVTCTLSWSAVSHAEK